MNCIRIIPNQVIKDAITSMKPDQLVIVAEVPKGGLVAMNDSGDLIITYESDDLPEISFSVH